MQINILLPLLCLAGGLIPAAASPIFEVIVGKNQIQIWMSEREFDPKAHRIERKAGAYGPETLLIDGLTPLGSDNLLPRRELSELRVAWNGKNLPVDAALYKDCYNPSLRTALHNSSWANLRFVVDPKGAWVQVLMFGSDGGGSYAVAWHLAMDGKHRRLDPKVFEFSN